MALACLCMRHTFQIKIEHLATVIHSTTRGMHTGCPTPLAALPHVEVGSAGLCHAARSASPPFTWRSAPLTPGLPHYGPHYWVAWQRATNSKMASAASRGSSRCPECPDFSRYVTVAPGSALANCSAVAGGRMRSWRPHSTSTGGCEKEEDCHDGYDGD